jgi:capsular exopolysaccharide synthesis family protein
MKKRPYDLNNKLISLRNPRSPIVEAFRSIRLNIQFAGRGKEIKTILVTSANPSEGKSITSSNLAIVMAQNNLKTLYIDADMRKPAGHYTFRLPNDKGLSSCLSGEHAGEEVWQRHTIVPNLFVMTAGPIPHNPLELLETEHLTHLLETVRVQFDMVIIDSPPLIVSDALLLASRMDGSMLVVDAKSTKQEAGVKAVELLRHANENILGVVMNNVKEKEFQYYY